MSTALPIITPLQPVSSASSARDPFNVIMVNVWGVRPVQSSSKPSHSADQKAQESGSHSVSTEISWVLSLLSQSGAHGAEANLEVPGSGRLPKLTTTPS